MAEKRQEVADSYVNNKDFQNAIKFLEIYLKIVREVGYRVIEKNVNCTLGKAYHSVGNFQKAIEYHEQHLKISKEVGDRAGEGSAYGNLGICYESLGDFQKAIEYHERHLKISNFNQPQLSYLHIFIKMAEKRQEVADSYVNNKDFQNAIKFLEIYLKIVREVGYRVIEKNVNCTLGKAYHSVGNFQKAIEYHEQHLKISKEVGDRAGEVVAYSNLGDAYFSLGELQKAIEYHKRLLKISKEVGNRAGEVVAYINLGEAYFSLGELQKAIEYYERHLKISKEVGDGAGEVVAYNNLGDAYFSLGELQKAIEYHKRHLKISKEVGNREAEGTAYCNLGNACNSLGHFQKAIEYSELHLKISKEMGDRAGEGRAYCNLGNAYFGLGDFQKAIKYHERHLKISKEVGRMAGEGKANCNLGNAYYNLGEFQKAIEYHERHLKISEKLKDRAGERKAYCNLANDYRNLEDFQKAKQYLKQSLKISKKVGDKVGEGTAYNILGHTYDDLGDFQKATEYHERHLKISKEVGDRAGEGRAYGSLGLVYCRLGDFQKAIEHHELDLKISKEVGDRAGEGRAYGSLGLVYCCLGDFQKAIEHHELDLKISKEVEGRAREGNAYAALANAHERVGNIQKAIQYYKNSIIAFDHIRGKLITNDEWKIRLRSKYDVSYSNLWGLQFKQGKVIEALFTADLGRAQALNDLLEFKYALKGLLPDIGTLSVTTPDMLSYLPSNTAFVGINEGGIVFWVNEKGKEIKARRTEGDMSVTTYFQSLLETTHEEIGVRADVYCEDRSLRNPSDKKLIEEGSSKPKSQPCVETKSLETLYNVVIDPISDLLHSDELVIVPQGPLCLAPYAAFKDLKSKYLCETFRIRLLPSLSSLRLIQNCPADWHSKTGALLVGNPWVQEVVYKGRTLKQLEWAEKEVQMIGEILQTVPLVQKQATKYEVLRRISSVALVHIAAHGEMETGEIALAPNSTRSSPIPAREDYLLTPKDVLKAQIRARLVVLSCCHSARGEVKAEGVVGIARAFLGAGARSVLVSLWAIDDEATMKFMKLFYHQLVHGRSASEALNEAMKSMRESDRFSAVKYWAPFVLIGDDVTLEFEGIK